MDNQQYTQGGQGYPQQGQFNNQQVYGQQGQFNGQQGYPQQGQPQMQGYPQQRNPQMQGYPQQGNPQMQGYPQQGNPQMQGYPQQGNPQMQGYPQQGNPQMQGYPQQGQPQIQGYPQQGQSQWQGQQPPKKKSSLGLILGLIFGSIFLLLVGIVALGVILSKTGAVPEADITADYFQKYNWLENDGSYLVLESSTRFKYYRNKDEQDDYYYTGTYEFYSGPEAISYVVDDLSEYGVTRDEIDGIIDRNEEYNTSNFVCLVIHNEEQIVDGEDIMENDVMTPYYGFYLKEGSNEALDIANMNAASYYYFTPEKK